MKKPQGTCKLACQGVSIISRRVESTRQQHTCSSTSDLCAMLHDGGNKARQHKVCAVQDCSTSLADATNLQHRLLHKMRMLVATPVQTRADAPPPHTNQSGVHFSNCLNIPSGSCSVFAAHTKPFTVTRVPLLRLSTGSASITNQPSAPRTIQQPSPEGPVRGHLAAATAGPLLYTAAHCG